MYFRSMTEDNTGNLWLATFNTITRFDPQTETSEDFYFTKDSLKKLPVFTHIIPDAIIIGNATLNDDDGSFWFGSDTRGLYQFNYTTNRLRSFWNPSNDSAYLSHNDVISLCNDPDNPQQYLWVGTEGGGLNKLDKTTGKVIRYTTSIGLPNNVINGMLFDKEKNMWVSTNHGICKFNPATLTVKCFDVNDGLQGNEFDRFKYFESAEGMMFFGGVNGVNYFYPDKIEDNHHIPQVVITDVRLQNRSVLVRDRHLLRTYTSTNSNTLTIPYSENIISVEFAALDFSNPNKNLFSHKLDGFNKDWSYPTTERTVTYTNLDPGKYVFHIRGSNNDGVWNMNGASLTFIILPPWYRTWWFYALSFIAIAGTIIGIIWYRFKQPERARQVQEDFARALMENQEAERKRISGELHDSVGQNILLIKNRAHFGVQGVQDLPSAHLQLNEIATLAADTLNQVREISHNLRPLHLDRLGLTQAIYMLLDQVEHNSTIKITSSINEIDNRVPKESEVNIFRIVQECLNNILKHAQAKNVTVTVTLEPEYIQIIIQDDGVGFDFDQKQRLTKNYGMGLSGLSERAKIIGGNLTIESSPGNGTKVLLKIPVSQTKI